jgi:hypothetical protein
MTGRILLATRCAFGFHSGGERRFSRNWPRAENTRLRAELAFCPVHHRRHADCLLPGLATGGRFRARNRKARIPLGRRHPLHRQSAHQIAARLVSILDHEQDAGLFPHHVVGVLDRMAVVGHESHRLSRRQHPVARGGLAPPLAPAGAAENPRRKTDGGHLRAASGQRGIRRVDCGIEEHAVALLLRPVAPVVSEIRRHRSATLFGDAVTGWPSARSYSRS